MMNNMIAEMMKAQNLESVADTMVESVPNTMNKLMVAVLGQEVVEADSAEADEKVDEFYDNLWWAIAIANSDINDTKKDLIMKILSQTEE